jgi:hypothetical protein
VVRCRPWETGTPPFQTFAVTVEAVDQAAPTAPVTVGSADVGKMIALLPGQLLHVALEGDSTGAWKFLKGDPMFVQQLGNWVVTPLGAGPARSLFTRTFIGIQPGITNLEFGFSASGEDTGSFDPAFSVTVLVQPVQPGNSTAVGEGDSGEVVTLAAGDTLVVRLWTATDGGYEWRVMATGAAPPSQPCAVRNLWRGGDRLEFRLHTAIGLFAPGIPTPVQTFTATTAVDWAQPQYLPKVARQ